MDELFCNCFPAYKGCLVLVLVVTENTQQLDSLAIFGNVKHVLDFIVIPSDVAEARIIPGPGIKSPFVLCTVKGNRDVWRPKAKPGD